MDLNADVGELGGDGGRRSDAALLGVVTTAHVACGGHAGDAESMRRTVVTAAERSVVVGAHPSYPDRDGFGRRPTGRPPAALRAEVRRQIEELAVVCRREDVPLRSVKAHGALYNAMCLDADLAAAVASAAADVDADLVLVVRAGAELPTRAGALAGLAVVAEGFCDRAYLRDGSLAPRATPGAVIDDPVQAGERAVSLALHGRVRALDGSAVPVVCDTLCVHGDHPGALATATAVRRALESSGIALRAYVSDRR